MAVPDCSFVIVSYRCLPYLKQCLDSIKKYAPEAEVVVVDNASDDGTREFLSGQDDIKFILSEKNLGFSAGCNLGMKQASSEVICFLNPDAALIDKNWKNAADKILQSKSCFVAPLIRNAKGQTQSPSILLPSFMNILMEALFLSYIFPPKPYVPRPKAVSGCCIMGSKSRLAELGGFDEGMFWCEDADLCIRHGKAGGEIVVMENWAVMHAGGKSSGKNYEISIPNQIISKFRYFKKHGMRADFYASIVPAYFHILTRLVLFGTIGIFQKEYLKKFRAYVVALRKLSEYLMKGDTPIL